MATILGRAAVWQLTNSVLSEIIFPISPTAPVSKMIEMLEHVLYKLSYLNLIPITKKKLFIPTRNPDDGLGGERHQAGSLFWNISELESTRLAPGMGDISPLTGGQRKVVNLASASQLTRSESDSHSGVFWRTWSKVASAQIAGCEDKSWAPSSILSPND